MKGKRGMEGGRKERRKPIVECWLEEVPPAWQIAMKRKELTLLLYLRVMKNREPWFEMSFDGKTPSSHKSGTLGGMPQWLGGPQEPAVERGRESGAEGGRENAMVGGQLHDPPSDDPDQLRLTEMSDP